MLKITKRKSLVLAMVTLIAALLLSIFAIKTPLSAMANDNNFDDPIEMC